MAFGLSRGRCHVLIDCHEESTTLLMVIREGAFPGEASEDVSGPWSRSTPQIQNGSRGDTRDLPFRSRGLAQFLFRLQPETHSVTHGASRVFPKRECMSTNLVRGNGGCLRSVYWIEASPVRGVGECRSLSGVNTDRFDPRSGGTADFA